MQSRGQKSGFTLIEMLAVIAIVGLLAALLLPALGRTQAKARRVQCLTNLRQTGIGFHSFLHDHSDNFPMQVSTNSGGTEEILLAGYRTGIEFYISYAPFQALSNDLASPWIFACPTDPSRTPANDFETLNNRNVSYFIGANADYELPNSILAGDRNIIGAAPGSSRTLVRLNESAPAVWTREMHGWKGNELFADGHAERVNGRALTLPRRNAPAVMDLLLPTIKPASPAPSALALDSGGYPKAREW
ncbi:MAG TPA: prepilin-type N-terminal cleavage/methylation domain-containing protein [Verrucomicrobiae bacterium]|nr:prepilin-type N-terminal cleavage/methylation domain-containing protein [Verrucomicrobiae bacterium]